MRRFPLSASSLVSIFLSLTLAACGGGGGDTSTTSSANNNSSSTSQPAIQESGAPAATGNTSTDGFNWTNFRRQQLGLTTLSRNSLIDKAAQNHSNYQQINNVISHEETRGLTGFTGETVLDRLVAAGYAFSGDYAYGEVISDRKSVV